MDNPFEQIQTPYVRILAEGLEPVFASLREKYGDRWQVNIEGTPDNGWECWFQAWDSAGLRINNESFHIGYPGITEGKPQ